MRSWIAWSGIARPPAMWSRITRSCTARCFATWSCVARSGVVRPIARSGVSAAHCAVLHCAVLHYAVLYCAALRYVVLRYAVPCRAAPLCGPALRGPALRGPPRRGPVLRGPGFETGWVDAGASFGLAVWGGLACSSLPSSSFSSSRNFSTSCGVSERYRAGATSSSRNPIFTRRSFSTSLPKCLNMMRIWFCRPSVIFTSYHGFGAVLDALQLRRRRPPAMHGDAFAELLFLRLGQRAVHLHHVSFGDVVGGRGEAMRELAVVGQQQQSLAVIIQPAHRETRARGPRASGASPSARPSGSDTVVMHSLGLLSAI